MPLPRVRLADLKTHCPDELESCEGYLWYEDQSTNIGSGAFGEVFLGWNELGTMEVAVKKIRRRELEKNSLAREYLEREIKIMKLLRNCEYVVHLHHVQWVKEHILLVMELCDCDLAHYVRASPSNFTEDKVTLFLSQLAHGMKDLRYHNIVHRDLKPENILVKKHPATGMTIKIADFGYARFFKTEGMKAVPLDSGVGTVVYMAPEALRCIENENVGQRYDEKVDIWSMGAVIYFVITGQPGFWANYKELQKILKYKCDALAFERVPGSTRVNYRDQLPATVNNRFSEAYRKKMVKLLRSMLKLEPIERMTFPQFFEYVDDLISSKVEVINLLHGTSFKIIFNPKMTPQQLMAEILGRFGLQAGEQLIFSSTSSTFLLDSPMTQEEFPEFLKRAKGCEGHPILYLLPIRDLSEAVEPYCRCLATLRFAVEDAESCALLIKEHKFSEEIVHAVKDLQSQQERQVAGVKSFCTFCSSQLADFTASEGDSCKPQGEGQQLLTRSSLAVDWLKSDLAQFASSSVHQSYREELQKHVDAVIGLRTELDHLIGGLGGLSESSVRDLKIDFQANVDLKEDFFEDLEIELRKLPKTRKPEIHRKCEQALQDCQAHAREITRQIQGLLKDTYDKLSGLWTMTEKTEQLKKKSAELEELLSVTIPQCRNSLLLKLLSAAVPTAAANPTPSPPVSTGSKVPATAATPRKPTLTSDLPLSPSHSPPAFVPVPHRLRTVSSPTSMDAGPFDAHNSATEKLQELYEAKCKECAELLAEEKRRETDPNRVFVKVARPEDYHAGDLVIFHPSRMYDSKYYPVLMHLERPKPVMVLNFGCYGNVGFLPSKPSLLLAKLTDDPQSCKFEEDPEMARAMGEASGTFYQVKAMRCRAKFARADTLSRLHM